MLRGPQYPREHEDAYDAVDRSSEPPGSPTRAASSPLSVSGSTPAASSSSRSLQPSPASTTEGMYKGGFAGKAMFTYRYSYRPAVWERMLTRAGFATAEAQVLECAAVPGHIGTLLVRAVAA